MLLQDMPASQAEELIAAAAGAPLSNPETEYPRWYLHRWHFLPEGYLSRRSAAGYDRVVRNVYNAFQEPGILREVTRRLRSIQPSSVLEVGSGPGRLLSRLARARVADDVVGLDLSPFLLERAARRLAGGSARLVHGDGLAIPTPDASFDAAVASHYVGHLPEPVRQRAVAELARIVRPGGSVMVVDHRWHPWPGSPLLRQQASTLCAFGSIRLSVFERVQSRATRSVV